MILSEADLAALVTELNNIFLKIGKFDATRALEGNFKSKDIRTELDGLRVIFEAALDTVAEIEVESKVIKK